jgi:hypothetical protein
MSKSRFAALVALVFAAAFVRLIPHPWNLTPVATMALFAGAKFDDRRWAFAVPLTALFLSDLLLGFYPYWGLVYLAHASVVAIGLTLRSRQNFNRVTAACVGGSVSFFFISNLAHFMTGLTYPMNFTGLMQCYVAAIPFFRNTLAGDLFFTALLFGSFHLAERRIPSLRLAPQHC